MVECHPLEYIGSAPGKVILFGEHAVVHGKRAIAGSVGLRTTARVRRGTAGGSLLYARLGNLGYERTWDLSGMLDVLGEDADVAAPCSLGTEAAKALQSLCEPNGDGEAARAVPPLLFLALSIVGQGLRDGGLSVIVDSELPVGAGLGSSASYCVALCAAMLAYRGSISAACGPADKELINGWAFEGEKLIHGNPSGVDNTVATFGGFISFQKGKPREVFDSFPALDFLITNTHVEKSTQKLVAGVRALLDQYPAVVNPLLQSIDGVGDSFVDKVAKLEQGALTKGQFLDAVGELVRLNQHLLNAIGVGHPAIDNVVAIASKAGLPTKLTGAGGGGCVISLERNCGGDRGGKDTVLLDLEACGYSCFRTVIGGEGVAVSIVQ